MMSRTFGFCGAARAPVRVSESKSRSRSRTRWRDGEVSELKGLNKLDEREWRWLVARRNATKVIWLFEQTNG